MLPLFVNHIEKFQLCEKSDRIMLAVSGGLDSTSMLYMFLEGGYNIAVAHCNFQLRGRESDADEEFVTLLCKELGVPVFVKRFETEAYAWSKTLSTQMAARELRYSWFKELIAKHQYEALATAHHFDDTMETILLNLTRGTGIDGMAGIPVRNGNIIRPFLFATRKQIESYAISKGLVWREDPTNETDNYQRNFVRHQIIPKLKSLNPSLETTWQSSIEKITGEIDLLSQVLQKWKDEFVSEAQDMIVIKKVGLTALPESVTLLWRYCRGFGFNFEQAKEMIQCLDAQPGKRFISHTHVLFIDRETLIITSRQQQWAETVIERGQPESFLGPWHIKIETVQSPVEPADEKSSAVLDKELLAFPLLWRKWRPGDYFYPLGMEHKKKLSDFFIDIKLSVAEKERVTVVESGGQIAWVAGYRLDNRFKLTANTNSGLRLTLGEFSL